MALFAHTLTAAHSAEPLLDTLLLPSGPARPCVDQRPSPHDHDLHPHTAHPSSTPSSEPPSPTQSSLSPNTPPDHTPDATARFSALSDIDLCWHYLQAGETLTLQSFNAHNGTQLRYLHNLFGFILELMYLKHTTIIYDEEHNSFTLQPNAIITPNAHADNTKKIVDTIIAIKTTSPSMSINRITHALYLQGFILMAPLHISYMCKALVVLDVLPAFSRQQLSATTLRTTLEMNPHQTYFKQKIFYPGSGKLSGRQAIILNAACNLKRLCSTTLLPTPPADVNLSRGVRAFLRQRPLKESWPASRIIRYINAHKKESASYYTRKNLEYDISWLRASVPGIALHPTTHTLCIIDDAPKLTISGADLLSFFVHFFLESEPLSLHEIEAYLRQKSMRAPHIRTCENIRTAFHLLDIYDDSYLEPDSRYNRLKPHWDRVYTALHERSVGSAKAVLRSLNFFAEPFCLNDRNIMRKTFILARHASIHVLQQRYSYARWQQRAQKRPPPNPANQQNRDFILLLVQEMTLNPHASFAYAATQAKKKHLVSIPQKLHQIQKAFALLGICDAPLPDMECLHSVWQSFLKTKKTVHGKHACRILYQQFGNNHPPIAIREIISRAHRLATSPELYALYKARNIPIPPELVYLAQRCARHDAHDDAPTFETSDTEDDDLVDES